jgi:hypothetical protein
MADDSLLPRVAVLERIADDTHRTLDRIETKLDRIEGRQADDFRFLVRLHMTQFVLMSGGFAAVLGVIARAQHWI